MPHLSDARIRAAQAREKPYKVFDTLGLFVRVDTRGQRSWRLRYRFRGAEKLLSLGPYPAVSLSRARGLRDEMRAQILAGRDPSLERRGQPGDEAGATFAAVAKEWLELQRRRFAPGTWVKAQWTFDDLVNPYIGKRPVSEITAPELLAVLRRLESRGKNETAHRARQRCGQIFRYAIATGRATRDVSADLKGALVPVVVRNRPAITEPRKIGELLIELRKLTMRSRYVFPAPQSRDRPMSENCITAALRRMGYTGAEMTWHGFRTIASTCLNEAGWNPELIELQLAHVDGNEVRNAYNRAQKLKERREMMQAWADQLDAMREGKAERVE